MTEHALIMCREPRRPPLWTKVMRKEARHTQMRDRASGVHPAFGAALQAIAGQRFPFRMKTTTAFQTSGFELSVRCIFSLVPGDIIFAVAKAAVKKTQREGFSWLSIPLKA